MVKGQDTICDLFESCALSLLERGEVDPEKNSPYHNESSPDRDSGMGTAKISNPV